MYEAAVRCCIFFNSTCKHIQWNRQVKNLTEMHQDLLESMEDSKMSAKESSHQNDDDDNDDDDDDDDDQSKIQTQMTTM